MADLQITPYIFFQGNCAEAMAFYRDILGGELTLITYGEESGDAAPEEWRDKIVHALLVCDGARLMACDSKIANPEARKVELLVSGSDETRLKEIFERLCEGGKAKQPLTEQSWGGKLGRLFDKYGIDWMVSVTPR